MGTFHTKCTIVHTLDRDRSAVIQKMLVDTGSEYTWVPARTLERLGIDREKKDLAFVEAQMRLIHQRTFFFPTRRG